MRELRLTAVSADGAHLILTDGDQQFALPADERLHAAIQGDRARLGQLEIQLENQLRPRDIQARVRAGESVEAVAADSTMPVEKVRRFAEPVLAERQHIAERGRQATLRRLAGEGPPRTLEAAAADHVSSTGASPETLEWDAWRSEDGKWHVSCSWTDTESGDADETGRAHAVFSFEPSGRSAMPMDATARVVAGEPRPEPEPEPAPEPPLDLPTGPARLSVVPTPEDDDADDESADHEATQSGARTGSVTALVTSDAQTRDDDTAQLAPSPLEPGNRRGRRPHRNTRHERRRREPELWHDDETEAPSTGDAEDTAATDRLRLSDIAAHVEVDQDEESDDSSTGDDGLAPTAQEPPPVAKPRSSRSRRPSVPTWDEIMFGRRKND